MKKIVLMAFATLLSITVVAQNNGVKTITLTDAERTLVDDVERNLVAETEYRRVCIVESGCCLLESRRKSARY